MAKWFFDGRGALRSGWKAVGFFLLLLLLASAVAWGLKGLGVQRGLGAWIAAIPVALVSWFCVRLEGRPFSSLGLLPGWHWFLEALTGILGGILLILLMALLARGAGAFHWERAPNVGTRQVLASAWMLLGVAFNEELLARGYPFQRLVERSGPWVGQLVLAGVFALGHWGNPGMHGATKAWATLNIGLAALLLGFCYLRTRSLALPIGVHLGWNWAQGSLLGFGVSGTTDIKGLWVPVFHGRPDWLSGGAFGLEASLPCALVSGLAIWALWRWKGTRRGANSSRLLASV